MFLVVPLVLIILMYGVILFVIMKSDVPTCKPCKMVRTSAAIVISGVIAYIPAAILNYLNTPLNYYVAHITTVTTYYINCVINPCIYFNGHPRIAEVIAEDFRRLGCTCRCLSSTRWLTALASYYVRFPNRNTIHPADTLTSSG
eukprot:sb/3473985/